MADSKITALTSISTSTDPANDPLVIVDVSDTSMAATGTTKKVTLNQLLGASGTATLASATITGDLTVRTNKLQVTSTGVGIGGASAAYPLEINGGASASTSQFKSSSASVITRFTDGTGETGYVGSGVSLMSGIGRTDFGIASNGALVFGVSTGLAMTLNSTGLGVGVASPAFKLDVAGSAGSGIRFTGNSVQNVIGETGGNGLVGTVSNHNLGLYTNATLRALIDTSGNVGIGVTPSAWAAGFKVLQVGSGPSISTNGNASRCDISTNYYYNGGNKFLTASGYATGISQENGNFYFQRSTTTSGGIGSSLTFDVPMTLDASGNLIIGTTGTNWSTVAGFYYFAGSSLNITRDGNPSLLLNRLTSDGAIADFRRSGSAVGSISVTTTSTAYNTSSDYRLKESVAPLTGGLARVSALKPSVYKWKADGSNGEGFLAHELAEVVPAAVSGEKDAVNEDGSIKAQGVDLSKVVPVLVAAIQELAAEVNALKNA